MNLSQEEKVAITHHEWQTKKAQTQPHRTLHSSANKSKKKFMFTETACPDRIASTAQMKSRLMTPGTNCMNIKQNQNRLRKEYAMKVKHSEPVHADIESRVYFPQTKKVA